MLPNPPVEVVEYISELYRHGRQVESALAATARPLTSTREGVPFRQVENDSLFFLNNGSMGSITDMPPLLSLRQPPIISFLLTPTVSNVRLARLSCV